VLEIIIAVGASGSGITGLTLWKSDYGQIAWGAISVAAIFVSIIKPILNLGHDIEEHSKLWAEYTTLFARFRNVIRNIESMRSRIAETGNLPQNMLIGLTPTPTTDSIGAERMYPHVRRLPPRRLAVSRLVA
jgi:hypothetical protein